MGVPVIGRPSWAESYKTVSGNPNPSRFLIDRISQYSNLTIALVRYDGCTNYEGKKIIVWRGLTATQVNDLAVIDPHFTEDNKIIARFVPTEEGWMMAKRFACMLEDC